MSIVAVEGARKKHMPDETSGSQNAEVKPASLVDTKGNPLSSKNFVPPEARSDFRQKTIDEKMAKISSWVAADKRKEFEKGDFNRRNLSFEQRQKEMAEIGQKIEDSHLTPEQQREKAWEEEKAKTKAAETVAPNVAAPEPISPTPEAAPAKAPATEAKATDVPAEPVIAPAPASTETPDELKAKELADAQLGETTPFSQQEIEETVPSPAQSPAPTETAKSKPEAAEETEPKPRKSLAEIDQEVKDEIAYINKSRKDKGKREMNAQEEYDTEYLLTRKKCLNALGYKLDEKQWTPKWLRENLGKKLTPELLKKKGWEFGVPALPIGFSKIRVLDEKGKEIKREDGKPLEFSGFWEGSKAGGRRAGRLNLDINKDFDLIRFLRGRLGEKIPAPGESSRPSDEPPNAVASTGKSEKELTTEGDKARKAYKDAEKARDKARRAYNKRLDKDKAFSSANKASLGIGKTYKEALAKSKLAEEVFRAESPGKELWEKRKVSWKVRDEAEDAFQATPEGKKLLEKWWNLDAAVGKAREVFRQPAYPEVPPAPEPAPAPAELEPVAKVEAIVIPGTEGSSERNVKLKINGEDSGMIWERSMFIYDGGLEKGNFRLKDIATAQGDLSIPNGTRLFIRDMEAKNAIHITGGKNAKLSTADLKELMDMNAGISLMTKDVKIWEDVSDIFEKEGGKANFSDPTTTINNLSIEEAIARFKEALKPSVASAPGERLDSTVSVGEKPERKEWWNDFAESKGFEVSQTGEVKETEGTIPLFLDKKALEEAKEWAGTWAGSELGGWLIGYQDEYRNHPYLRVTKIFKDKGKGDAISFNSESMGEATDYAREAKNKGEKASVVGFFHTHPQGWSGKITYGDRDSHVFGTVEASKGGELWTEKSAHIVLTPDENQAIDVWQTNGKAKEIGWDNSLVRNNCFILTPKPQNAEQPVVPPPAAAPATETFNAAVPAAESEGERPISTEEKERIDDAWQMYNARRVSKGEKLTSDELYTQSLIKEKGLMPPLTQEARELLEKIDNEKGILFGLSSNVRRILNENGIPDKDLVGKESESAKLIKMLAENRVPEQENESHEKPAEAAQVASPAEETLDAAVPTEKSEGELTELEKAQKAYEDTDKAWREDYGVYKKALNLDGNETYAIAYKNWSEALRSWRKAFEESKLTNKAVFNAGKGEELFERERELYKIMEETREKIGDAFHATEQGRKLNENNISLWEVRKNAEEALKQAKTKSTS